MATCKNVPLEEPTQERSVEHQTTRSALEAQAWRKLKTYMGSWPRYVRTPDLNPYRCVEPEVGKLLPRYNRWSRHPSERILPWSQRQCFFAHLKACRRCQESLDEHGWVIYFMRLIVTELTPEEQAAIKRLFTGS